MSTEARLTSQAIIGHYQFLEDRLSNVPELEPAFDLLSRSPQHASDVYLGYVALITAMTNLDASDMEKIARSQRILQQSGGGTGSASIIGANNIVSALGERKNLLVEVANDSVNPHSAHYQQVVETLVTKLEGGHKLKLSGKSPSDHDPESLKVIWGHTLITGPEALLHFVTCHYLGLYYAKTLGEYGLEFTKQKDFFVNALADVVILNHLRSDISDPIFDIWATPKQAGGMGWITEPRLKSYT